MTFDRKYLLFSLCYVVVGMSLGIYMAATHNHSQLVAHTHILLVGFVISFIYSTIHKLWLSAPGKAIATVQFVLHHVATVVMFIGLLLLYGNVLPGEQVEPVLATSAVSVLVAALLMFYMVLRPTQPRDAAAR
jgi:hypothetical protein